MFKGSLLYKFNPHFLILTADEGFEVYPLMMGCDTCSVEIVATALLFVHHSVSPDQSLSARSLSFSGKCLGPFIPFITLACFSAISNLHVDFLTLFTNKYVQLNSET